MEKAEDVVGGHMYTLVRAYMVSRTSGKVFKVGQEQAINLSSRVTKPSLEQEEKKNMEVGMGYKKETMLLLPLKYLHLLILLQPYYLSVCRIKEEHV